MARDTFQVAASPGPSISWPSTERRTRAEVTDPAARASAAVTLSQVRDIRPPRSLVIGSLEFVVGQRAADGPVRGPLANYKLQTPNSDPWIIAGKRKANPVPERRIVLRR